MHSSTRFKSIGGCNYKGLSRGSYAGCHRYDQSALNMILIREFGARLSAIFKRERPIASSTFKIQRTASSAYAADIKIL